MKKTTQITAVAAGVPLLLGVGHVAGEGIKDVANYSKANQAQDASFNQLNRPLVSRPELFNKEDVIAGLGKNGIDASKVTIHEVTNQGATPTSVAKAMHAENVPMVAEEITTEVGGEHSLIAGEFVAVSNNQIDQPK